MTNVQDHDTILDRAYSLWAAAGYPDLGALAFYEQAKRDVHARREMQQGIAAGARDGRHVGPSGALDRR